MTQYETNIKILFFEVSIASVAIIWSYYLKWWPKSEINHFSVLSDYSMLSSLDPG